jgi:sugar phosphate permease
VLGFVVIMAVILYLDRMAISVALPAIARDLNLDLSELADSVAVFFWCYALFQIPAGWLGDRWGGRRALVLYVVAWSLAISGMGLVGGLLSLMLMRGLLGIGQAGAYATSASLLRRWTPHARRGFATSAVSLGGRAGNVLAPTLTSLLMRLAATAGMEADRWRPVFLGYGLIGLIWAALFWRWFRDEPRLHAGCNQAEIDLIRGDAQIGGDEPIEARDQHAAAAAFPLRAMLTHRGLQLLALVNFVVNVGWIFVGTLLPTYLIKIHDFSEVDAGLAASCTAAAGMAGSLCGGLATDGLVKRLGLRWGRRVPGLICCGGAATVYFIVWNLDDARAIVTLLIVASFFGDFALGSMWATCQDIGGPLAGTVFGTANMCGNIGAALAASLIARLAERFGWSSSFLLSTGAYLSGMLCWLAIDPTVPIAGTNAEREPAVTPDEA